MTAAGSAAACLKPGIPGGPGRARREEAGGEASRPDSSPRSSSHQGERAPRVALAGVEERSGARRRAGPPNLPSCRPRPGPRAERLQVREGAGRGQVLGAGARAGPRWSGVGARSSYPVPQSTTQGGREPAMLGTRAAPSTPAAREVPPLSACRDNPTPPAPGSLRSASAGSPDALLSPRDASPD